MSPDQILDIIRMGIFGAVSIVGISIGGWVYNTRQKIRNGYPLESMWGKPLHPQITNEASERVTLLTRENAELRAQIGSLRDRLNNVERIVTDGGYGLGAEIEKLRVREDKVL